MTESAALARSLGLRLHTHLAETLDEERDSLARFGRRPMELLDELGWIAPDVWVAHGIHFSDDEVRRLGATRTGIAHCPSSNCRLGSGIARVRDLVAAGAPVGLGVDGVASNEIGDADARAADVALPGPPARVWTRPPSPPRTRSPSATSGGAACLGRTDIGALEVGLKADLVVWPGDDLADVLDPLAGLVLGPERSARHVLVGGEYVVRDGALVGADLADLRRDLTRRARRLWPG